MSPAPGDTREFSSTEISFAAEVMASSQEPAPWSRLLWPQLLLEGLRESVDTTWTPRDVCDHLGTEAHVTDLEQANGVWETQLTFILILFLYTASEKPGISMGRRRKRLSNAQ